LLRFLLDTNIISELIRRPNGAVAQRVKKLEQNKVCTSIIVAAELRYGAAKAEASRFAQRIEEALTTIDVLPFASPADSVYAQIRARLQRSGTIIGANDLLIAAHAMALGHTLVTANEREFARVDGLPLANWLRPG
jgi:tRNA(fMet)-specific endonuclease VapC